jgi:hypothetical protein
VSSALEEGSTVITKFSHDLDRIIFARLALLGPCWEEEEVVLLVAVQPDNGESVARSTEDEARVHPPLGVAIAAGMLLPQLCDASSGDGKLVEGVNEARAREGRQGRAGRAPLDTVQPNCGALQAGLL